MKSLCIILEKSQAVVVVISTVFINPDIYLGLIISQVHMSWTTVLSRGVCDQVHKMHDNANIFVLVLELHL